METTDSLPSMTLPTSESFSTGGAATSGEVPASVSLTPGTGKERETLQRLAEVAGTANGSGGPALRRRAKW
jgi:hypothetical protein